MTPADTMRAAVEALTDEQIDALDKKFALGVMAPRGKDSVRDFARAVLAASPAPVKESPFTVATALRRLIADDAYAMTFQTFGQYRTALLKAIDLASIPPNTPVEAGKVGVADGVPVVDEAQERIAFEAWCESRGRGHSTVLKFDNGDYRNETAREEWRGWLGRATHSSGVVASDGGKPE